MALLSRTYRRSNCGDGRNRRERIAMTDRIERQAIYRLQPANVNSLRALGEAPVSAVVEKTQLVLVDLHGVQVNRRALCLNTPSDDNRRLGRRQERHHILTAGSQG